MGNGGHILIRGNGNQVCVMRQDSLGLVIMNPIQWRLEGGWRRPPELVNGMSSSTRGIRDNNNWSYIIVLSVRTDHSNCLYYRNIVSLFTLLMSPFWQEDSPCNKEVSFPSCKAQRQSFYKVFTTVIKLPTSPLSPYVEGEGAVERTHITRSSGSSQESHDNWHSVILLCLFELFLT